MSLRQSALCVSALAAALLSACGGDADTCGAHEADLVAVHPRLVMDGMVELAAREQGHVQITEVVFHAPSVLRADALRAERLAGEGAEDALVFRYAVGASDRYGDIVGGERSWPLAGADELRFDFAPAPAHDVDALSALTGVDLQALAGHTAFVRGTVAVPAAPVHGFSAADSDPDTSPARPRDAADGDPDTSPGDEADTGDDADSDPDTSPARGAGQEADSDPDTSPATLADSDPDTSPARPRPGKRGESDPDTSPARAEDGRTAQKREKGFSTRPALSLDEGRALTRVPFLLVIKERFALTRSVADLPLADLAPEEILPLDLHVDMAAMFSAEQVAALASSAQTAGVSRTVVLEASVAGAVNIALDAQAVKKVAARSPGIRVTGDLR